MYLVNGNKKFGALQFFQVMTLAWLEDRMREICDHCLLPSLLANHFHQCYSTLYLVCCVSACVSESLWQHLVLVDVLVIWFDWVADAL